ncbi:hypothetical protein PG997_015195 [Apiospora hydei]|uniref:Cell surface protein n=1 Tax=Apiospora hydei TaxID=1337664 RepID=A0ABR1UVZ4_9PEZI
MTNTTSEVPHSGTTGTHGHNKLAKDAPYDEYGSGVGGTHGRSHNDGLTSGHQGTHGTTGMTGSNHGMTGNHGNAAMAGAETGITGAPHGTGMTGSHGTGMTGANTGMTGANNGMTGSNHGATGNTHNTPGMMTGATGTHVTYDDRINPGTPTTSNQSNVRTGTSTGGPGLSGSNMTHRPADGGNNLTRDHKVDEYDAPTNSSGRGKQGLAGAAGGVAASELANRHHKDDMHAYNTPGASGMDTADRWHNRAPGHSGGANEPSLMGTTHMNPTGVNSGMAGGHPNSGIDSTSRGVNEPMMGGHNATGPMGNTTGGVPGAHGHHNTNSGSMLDPTGSSATHGAGMGHTTSGAGGHTSMLDPHNTTSRTTYGHDTGHHSHHGHRENSDGMARGMAPHMAGGGMAADEYAAGVPEPGMAGAGNHGMTGSHGMTGNTHGVPNEAGMTGSHMGSGTEHDLGGNPTSPHNTTSGGGLANKVTGMGDGHHGPGHAGAKVLHRCDHCGSDNDISRYFSKEAAYRMS